jgi:hypothetical protein
VHITIEYFSGEKFMLNWGECNINTIIIITISSVFEIIFCA